MHFACRTVGVNTDSIVIFANKVLSGGRMTHWFAGLAEFVDGRARRYSTLRGNWLIQLITELSGKTSGGRR